MQRQQQNQDEFAWNSDKRNLHRRHLAATDIGEIFMLMKPWSNDQLVVRKGDIASVERDKASDYNTK